MIFTILTIKQMFITISKMSIIDKLKTKMKNHFRFRFRSRSHESVRNRLLDLILLHLLFYSTLHKPIQINSIQYRGEQIMELTIYSLDESLIDKLITPDMDLYAKVIRQSDRFDMTVDILIKVVTFAVDARHLIIEFPNNNCFSVDIPRSSYLKVEVM